MADALQQVVSAARKEFAGLPHMTGGRTHFEGTDDPATIARLAAELAESDLHDDAAAVLEAFRVAYPDQRAELDELVGRIPALAGVASPS